METAVCIAAMEPTPVPLFKKVEKAIVADKKYQSIPPQIPHTFVIRSKPSHNPRMSKECSIQTY